MFSKIKMITLDTSSPVDNLLGAVDSSVGETSEVVLGLVGMIVPYTAIGSGICLFVLLCKSGFSLQSIKNQGMAFIGEIIALIAIFIASSTYLTWIEFFKI